MQIFIFASTKAKTVKSAARPANSYRNKTFIVLLISPEFDELLRGISLHAREDYYLADLVIEAVPNMLKSGTVNFKTRMPIIAKWSIKGV